MSEYDDGSEQSSRAGDATRNATKRVAKKGAKKASTSLWKLIVTVLGIKVAVAVVVTLLVFLLIAAAAGAISQASAAPTASGCVTGGVQPVSGTAPGLTPEQNTNASLIAGAALSLGLGYEGALVGVLTANVESDLRNVGFGDMVGPGGSMSSSRGLFQQIAAWGPLADRMDPVKSATMFFTGGQQGQKGLTGVAGWQSMPPEIAMQAVQQSEFSQQPGDQSPGLAAKLAAATAAVKAYTSGRPGAAPVAAAVPCPVSTGNDTGTVVVDGVAVTIPDNPNVATAVRGKVIQAPNAKVAKGLAAGFAELGLPYVWGGGGDGAGPNNGCARGGGSLNSCGTTIGLDCSGLTAYVLVQGGFPSPGGESTTQRSTGTDVPWASGLPGDIVGFPGHVAIYLGNIGGTDYILEASDVGTPIRIVANFRSDHDPVLHRHWS